MGRSTSSLTKLESVYLMATRLSLATSNVARMVSAPLIAVRPVTEKPTVLTCVNRSRQHSQASQLFSQCHCRLNGPNHYMSYVKAVLL